MSKKALCGVGVALLIGLGLSVPSSAQVCGPLDDGHLADASYQGTAVYWAPVREFDKIVLTISGPCEDIVKSFGSKDEIMFDLREIERVTDGQYHWKLEREASIDPAIQEQLQAARGSGKEDEIWWSFFQAGKIPDGPYSESGHFTVERGQIVDPASGEEKEQKVARVAPGGVGPVGLAAAAGGFAADGSEGGNALSTKQVISGDLTVYNSLCVGFDCLNSESYGSDTIRLKENNLRIHFDDTSTAGSFPNQDWRIEANSNLNGGGEWLRFIDATANRNIMTLEANAPSDSLVVDSGGRVGFGTANPVVELHTANGDTPTLRLDQTGASGFAPQVWDVAGNETSFFVRDATNGSTLPFRIFPSNSSNQLVIRSNQIGVGTINPDSGIHVVETAAGVVNMLKLEATGAGGRPRLIFSNPNGSWFYEVNGDNFEINRSGSGGSAELLLETNGDLTIGGTLTELSSRSAKDGFEALDPTDVLARVVGLPVLAWRYTADDDQARHIGPMAEDFYQAFGLGKDDHHIAPGDKAGVALVAIQGLQLELAKRDARIDDLSSEKAALEERLDKLEALIEALSAE